MYIYIGGKFDGTGDLSLWETINKKHFFEGSNSGDSNTTIEILIQAHGK